MSERQRRILELDSLEDLIAFVEAMEKTTRVLAGCLMDIQLRIGKVLAILESLPEEGEVDASE